MTLFARLSLVFLIILTILGGFSLWIAERSARLYFLEFTQRLNAPIAMYMVDNAGLVNQGTIDTQALSLLAEHVMMVNPSVEVYVLDLQGRVMAQAANANVIAQPRVSMGPIREALRQGRLQAPGSIPVATTLLGDDPLDPDVQRPFSVHPLTHDEQPLGYVYALLAGRGHQTLLSAIRSSHSLRDLVWILSGVVVLAGVAGSVVFFSLTRRLRGLTRHVLATNGTSRTPLPAMAVNGSSTRQRRHRHDEIDELSTAYDSMANQLQAQYQSLAEKDRIRRELIANISHDLRTPLTTLQGYLETVLTKHDKLDPAVTRRYLAIAHKHGLRMRRLVSELFELSKFESGEFELEVETFSMLELAHDALQDMTPRAQRRQISLIVKADGSAEERGQVHADIALIHRALENLLDNALRFTRPGGCIAIEIAPRDGDRIDIAVTDDGVGMQAADARLAFEPRFRADTDSGSQKELEESGHAGLGLAIVKSILKLHGSDVKLDTRPDHGTRFSFSLPVLAAAR